MAEQKKEWVKPSLLVYGDMAALTQQPLLKQVGDADGLVLINNIPANISSV